MYRKIKIIPHRLNLNIKFLNHLQLIKLAKSIMKYININSKEIKMNLFLDNYRKWTVMVLQLRYRI
jgi:hypothetical protein